MKRDPSGYWNSIGIKGDAPGHPFRGNQYTVGASGEEMLHGTTTPRLDSILKEGITPGHQANWGKQFFTGNRKGKVFLTTDKQMAMDYAADALQQLFKDMTRTIEKGPMPRCCVFRVQVPAGTVLEQDWASARKKGDAYMLSKVPPEWIKGYDVYDFNPFAATFKLSESHTIGKGVETDQSVYVPIIWLEDEKDEA